ncbi:DUF6153 family protein [Streptomyces capillispiralis]|nr:DUF6153 family protein [Streptomyces capillispiralis]
MSRSTRSSSRPAGRLFVVLVMAVLAGVLGMHGLAPDGVPAAHSGAGHAGMTADRAVHADADCAHTEGGPGHLDHADGACAAAGTSSTYTPPAPASASLDAPAAPARTTADARAPRDGRAPPDLSELQLLRI